MSKDYDTSNFYLVVKEWNGYNEVRNKKTGSIMTWRDRTSCQVAACKMFGIGKKDVKMYQLLPNNNKELIKDWSKIE